MQIKQAISGLRIREFAAIAVFAMMLAASVVLSNHIQIGNDTYAGLATENCISPYGAADIAVFALASAIAFALCLLVYILIKHVCGDAKRRGDDRPLRAKPIAICAAIMFALHIPYLLTYYPGLIFSDSLASISQALGYAPYSNHHPVAYTLIVQACIQLAHAAGLSTTTGCALYSLIQTALMCMAYSMMIQWIAQRTGVGIWCRILLVAVFGLSPYIATYSVAMWKDPLFSAAIVVVTVLLFDYAKSAGAIVKSSKAWIPLFALSCMAIAFLRSNGLLIDLGVFLALGIPLLLKAARREQTRIADCAAAAIPAIALVANLIVTGPVYAALGVIPNEKVEGYGIPLNQMARVAALGGDMTESDMEYMDQLLPLGEYANVYAPTCSDPLKWNAQFNSAGLENDFAEHWASMLFRNPVAYFESWELQTFGYWTINHPSVLLHTSNISGGVPRTADNPGDLESYGITPRNILGGWAESAFPCNSLSIPLGWATWGIAFLTMALALQSRKRYVIVLIPCLMLAASLLVASPIWYWERYGAALQFLVPLFIAMPFALAKGGRREQAVARPRRANRARNARC